VSSEPKAKQKNQNEQNNPQTSMLLFALKPPGRNGARHPRPRCGKLASVALSAAALLTAASAPAAQLTWDAGDTNNGATIDAASGAWNTDTANLNWNNGSGNVSWTQTSVTAALNGATFAGADAAAGTYQVALDGSKSPQQSYHQRQWV
jgi:hypothetical protein